MGKIVAFPDTNLFLHFRPLNEIDWREFLDASAVEIKIAPVVTHELEEQKTLNKSRQIRERAATALKLLHGYLGHSQVREGVTLEFLINKPHPESAAAGGFNLQLGDDRLIGTLLLYRDQHPDVPCTLVTADLPLLVKATHYQIQLTTPKESLRLPSEPDPLEKRNKQLEAELLRYKSRQPILEVQFKDGQNHSRFQIARSSDVDTDSAETIQAMLAKAREKCPLLELRSLQDPEVAANTMNPLAELGETIRKITESFGEFGRRFYEDYNARASAYYRDYEKYLRDTIAFKTLGARTIRLDLVLDNSGTCPAEDVVIVLHFPDGFELWDENNPPKEPQEPKAPSKELNLYPNISFLSTIPDLRLPLPRNRSLPRIRKTNSYEVTFETDKLQHGFIWTLTPLYAVFDSWESAKSFSIDFAIHAGNTIDERTGQLAVVIVKT